MARVEPRLDSPVGPKAAAVLHVHTYTSSPPLRVTVERAEEKLRRRLEPGVGTATKDPPGGLESAAAQIRVLALGSPSQPCSLPAPDLILVLVEAGKPNCSAQHSSSRPRAHAAVSQK